jgi:hypothetical protein
MIKQCHGGNTYDCVGIDYRRQSKRTILRGMGNTEHDEKEDEICRIIGMHTCHGCRTSGLRGTILCTNYRDITELKWLSNNQWDIVAMVQLNLKYQ